MTAKAALPPADRSRVLRPGAGRLILPLGGSRLAGMIVLLNIMGLVVLIVGALVLNEFRRGLVEARVDSLTTEGEFIANVLARAATRGDPDPQLMPGRAAETIQLLFLSKAQRARLFDTAGEPVADSDLITDRIEQQPLPPARRPGLGAWMSWPSLGREGRDAARRAKAREALRREVRAAMQGAPVSDVRPAVTGERVVSVSIPIQRVQAVLGVLTLETRDVDRIVSDQRRALLIPLAPIAVVEALLLSLMMHQLVARPVLRLARAADSVRLSRARAISLPDLAERDDEVGDLTRSLEAMTDTLSARMDAIERFAADVSHEIKNPLTSIRSAVETLEMADSEKARARLLPILKADVSRLDRLITDISNASRLDAELSREAPRPVDLQRLLTELVAMAELGAPGAAAVRLVSVPTRETPVLVTGREGPLSQVLRNVIDNARSFSPPGGEVRLALMDVPAANGGRTVRVTVDDDGPGMPPENLESIFDRFYTERPRGAGSRPRSATLGSVSRSRARSWPPTAARCARRTGWTRRGA